MYRASGALFNTMETVAGEKPLACATSRMVTLSTFPLIPTAPQTKAVPGIRASSTRRRLSPQASRSSPQFHLPGIVVESEPAGQNCGLDLKAIPASIQIEPTILAGWLRFHHNPRQMKKPADGETKFITFFCSALTK